MAAQRAVRDPWAYRGCCKQYPHLNKETFHTKEILDTSERLLDTWFQPAAYITLFMDDVVSNDI